MQVYDPWDGGVCHNGCRGIYTSLLDVIHPNWSDWPFQMWHQSASNWNWYRRDKNERL